MGLEVRRFKSSSTFGMPGLKPYERRRKRLARRTQLPGKIVKSLNPYIEAKEDLFSQLMYGKEKPTEMAKRIILQSQNLSEKGKAKIASTAAKLDWQWGVVREHEKAATANPVKFFENFFHVKAADNGVLVRVSSCDIHIGLSRANWELLKREGFVEGRTTFGMHDPGFDQRIGNWDLSRVTSYSMANFGHEMKIEQRILDEELRHHFQLTEMPKSKKDGSISSIDDIVRKEFAARARHEEPLTEDVREYLHMYYQTEMVSLADSKAWNESSLANLEKADILKGDTREETLRVFREGVEKSARDMKRAGENFAKIEKILTSERFTALIMEAQRTVPPEKLASYIESVNLFRLEKILPQLIKKYGGNPNPRQRYWGGEISG
jgi:DNA polymerase III delta prime subunit